MLLLSFISLLDRSILGILSPVILNELHLSATQYGQAIFVFSLCYMIANPVWGLLMDRWGSFLATALAVALWSAASGAHALLTGFVGLAVMRGLLGFGEAATFPAGLKTVTETMPPDKRSFALGVAYSGGSLGALLTPIVIVPLAAQYGWRSTFLLSALAGFLWIGGWLMLRSTGLYRPAMAGSKLGPQVTSNPASNLRWNRRLVASAAVYGLGAAPIAYELYSAPLYLTRVLHQPQSSLAHLLWIPPAGWELGYLVWGRVADRRRSKAQAAAIASESASLNPAPTGLFTFFAAGSLTLAAIPFATRSLPDPQLALYATVFLYFFAMFLSGGFVVIALADGATQQTASNTGLLAGFSISGWSLTTGILMWQVGRMFDRGQYSQTFWLTAVLPTAGVLLWRALGGHRRTLPPDRTQILPGPRAARSEPIR